MFSSISSAAIFHGGTRKAKTRTKRPGCYSSKRNPSASRIYAPACPKRSRSISIISALNKMPPTTTRIILICASSSSGNFFVRVSSTIMFTTGRFASFFKRRQRRPTTPPPPWWRFPLSPNTHRSLPQSNRHQKHNSGPTRQSLYDVVRRIHINQKEKPPVLSRKGKQQLKADNDRGRRNANKQIMRSYTTNRERSGFFFSLSPCSLPTMIFLEGDLSKQQKKKKKKKKKVRKRRKIPRNAFSTST